MRAAFTESKSGNTVAGRRSPALLLHAPGETAGEAQHQELLRLLDEEITHLQEKVEYAEKVNEERAAIGRFKK